jgi:hypothetical protein
MMGFCSNFDGGRVDIANLHYALKTESDSVGGK